MLSNILQPFSQSEESSINKATLVWKARARSNEEEVVPIMALAEALYVYFSGCLLRCILHDNLMM